jgi:hypothetical protein
VRSRMRRGHRSLRTNKRTMTTRCQQRSHRRPTRLPGKIDFPQVPIEHIVATAIHASDNLPARHRAPRRTEPTIIFMGSNLERPNCVNHILPWTYGSDRSRRPTAPRLDPFEQKPHPAIAIETRRHGSIHRL